MGSAVRLIRSDALSDVAEYAYAASVESGARLIHLAGSCPLEKDGSTAGVGDYAAQAAKCTENLIEALRAADATIHDVVSTRVLVASSQQADLVTAWDVVREAFGDHDVPSTLMGVTVLGYDDQLVEIEAVAAVRDASNDRAVGTFDLEVNAAYLPLVPEITPGSSVEQVVVPREGGDIMLDFDADGRMLGVEVLGARGLLRPETLNNLTEI